MEEEKDSIDLRRATEFFGFPPSEFVDNVVNAVADYICDGIDEVENALIERNPRKEKAIRDGAELMTETLRDAAHRNLDKFELYVLRNILRVPRGVDLARPIQLPVVEAEGSPTDASEFDKTSKRVEELRRKVLARRLELRRLLAVEKRSSSVETFLNSVVRAIRGGADKGEWSDDIRRAVEDLRSVLDASQLRRRIQDAESIIQTWKREREVEEGRGETEEKELLVQYSKRRKELGKDADMLRRRFDDS